MHMKQNTISSLFASIDAARDAFRCEKATVRYHAHIEGFALAEHHYPDGRVHIRPAIALKRVKDDAIVEVEACRVLNPKAGESLLTYLDRLTDYVEYLDDHALFIEVVELCNA